MPSKLAIMGIHNLPLQSTPFIGREQELAEAVGLLDNAACQLVTLTGPGGIGKTRLALEVGAQAATRTRQFLDGVYFVPLQPLNSADLLLSAIADALKFQFSTEGEPEAQLFKYLHTRSLILILDNFEHLMAGAELISRLVVNASRVKILVTSREALNLQEEWLYIVPGMRYPQFESEHPHNAYDAIQLFHVCARRARSDFAFEREYRHIQRICQLVDGMPLALELAAAWVRTLTCAELADEMERGLDLLETGKSNMPPRHQNLRKLFDQAWDRLTEVEQASFRKLSVFRGGFTRHAAGEIADCSLHTLAALVDKSWVRHLSTGRYDIHELLRQYGKNRLAADHMEVQQTKHRHCAYFAAFLKRQWADRHGGDQVQARAHFESELGNVRICWEHAISHRRLEDIDSAFRTLWNMYDNSGRFQEAAQAFGMAADALRIHEPGSETESLFAKILHIQGRISFSLVRLSEGEQLLRQSLAILERSEPSPELAECLLTLAQNIFAQSNRISEGQKFAEQGREIALIVKDDVSLAGAYSLLGYICSANGDTEQAWQLHQQSLDICLKLKNTEFIAECHTALCLLAAHAGKFEDAKHYGEMSLQAYQQLGVAWGIAMAQSNLAEVAYCAGDFRRVERLLLETLLFAAPHHLKTNLATCLKQLADLRLAQGNLKAAVELYCVSEQYIMAFMSPNKERTLADLQTKLPKEVFTAAVQRGRQIDFDTAVQQVIAELQQAVLTTISSTLLTEREIEVLQLVAEGFSNRKIADALVLSLGTVKWYVSDIYSRLGVSNRTQAVARARELRLISDGSIV